MFYFCKVKKSIKVLSVGSGLDPTLGWWLFFGWVWLMRVNFWHPISFPVSIDKSNNIFLCLQNPQAGFKFEVSDPGLIRHFSNIVSMQVFVVREFDSSGRCIAGDGYLGFVVRPFGWWRILLLLWFTLTCCYQKQGSILDAVAFPNPLQTLVV